MQTKLENTVTLNNGAAMPRLGLGTYEAHSGGQVEQAVRWALDLGYRSLDTASAYENETGVGGGLQQSGVPREEVFLTTKVWNNEQGGEETRRAIQRSLKRLNVDYVDLYLIHWPIPSQLKDTWKAMENIQREGLARSIGVSNFLIHHLEPLLDFAEIPPTVNQVEFHPYLQQPELIEFCESHKIQVEAWSPLMKGGACNIPELKKIGEKYGKSAAQVTLRWDLQRGLVTIPKSTHKDRIESNARIFDFELSEQDMQTINALDRNERIGPHPDMFPTQ